MRSRFVLAALGLVSLTAFSRSARAAGPPQPTRMYAGDAFLVTAAQASVDGGNALQAALDAHQIVRLQGGDDYSKTPAITMKSGEQLFGLGMNRLPTITIAPGASNVVVTNVNADIVFPASTNVTRDNLFLEISGSFQVDGATLEDNTLVGFEGGYIAIDTSASGYLRNNRFVRVHQQGSSHIMLSMKGDPAHQSYDNVFVWGNDLTQPEDVSEVSDQRDVTFIGWDDEAYAPDASTPVYSYTGIDFLQLWTFSGASQGHVVPGFDVSATEVQASNIAFYLPFSPAMTLESPVERALLFSSIHPVTDKNPSGFRISGTDNQNAGASLTEHDAGLTAALLGDAGAATLQAMLEQPTRTGVPWEQPTFDPPPDPAGANWNVDLGSKTDDTAMIQALLDAADAGDPRAYAILPAGTFYISAPLRIHYGGHLLGAGQDQTVIIAKDPSIDMIVGDVDAPLDAGDVALYSFQIGDLTFEGGTNGFHMQNPIGSPSSMQFSGFDISHVTFRNIANVGVFVDTYAQLDNGLFDSVNFVGCGTAFMQSVSKAADAGGPDTTSLGYIDKVVFYRNQFLNNGTAVDLEANRQDNLNVFVSSLFQGNTVRVLKANGAVVNTMLLNSNFIDNAGDPSVSGAADLIGDYFRADELGVSLVGGIVSIEGSRFERGKSTTATLFGNPANPFFAPNNAWMNFSSDYVRNSSADAIPLGNVEFGAFLNNAFPSRPDLSQLAVVVTQDAAQETAMDASVPIVTTIATGTVNPVGQLLFGSSYAEPDAGADGGAISDAGPNLDAASRGDATLTSTDAGAIAKSSGGNSGGCGCRITRAAGPNRFAWLVLVPLAFFRRRRAASRRGRSPLRRACSRRARCRDGRS